MKNFRSALLAAALSLVVAAGSATAAQTTTKIRVGASPTPHAEILKVARNPEESYDGARNNMNDHEPRRDEDGSK